MSGFLLNLKKTIDNPFQTEMNPMEITKILVANRGEIAIRVMRSARELGIRTVAIYSTADRTAPHVRYADEAICVGNPPSSESYLRMDNIIEACQTTGANAVHPGYGFLSENAEFSRKVSEAGLIFIGPSPESIKVMGDKLASKQAVKNYGGVPMVPGMEEAVTDVAIAKKRANEIGYPIMIKASAGGGGKGMRVVENESEFEEQMERAVSEAVSSFGNGAVFIEKFITSPKHIEFQIMGDQHGNVIHFFERECSVQRRHQKVIEEAPSSCLTPEVRKTMGEAAVNVAKSCNYYGAGTVEFIVDANLNFYFLEMNTRLQVEHPVSEEITGVDLVKQQIRVAEGKPLSIRQEDLKIQGHSIEVRVYAEDPRNHFLPDIGTLQTYRPPKGVGIRVDDGFEEGMKIPIYYDPMIAKLVTYADNRQDAIRRMIRAIDEYQITGIQTTLPFCRFVMQHQAYTSGNFDTKFVEKYYTPEVLDSQLDDNTQRVAVALVEKLLRQSNSTIISSTQNSGMEVVTQKRSKWRDRAKI